MNPRSDRDRGDRDRRPAPQGNASNRSNEYFVPRDGIDREVITADICRYLGNDALVRPGNYINPQTNQSTPGYFITAYRNLTTAMIADLKADSDRWEAERRATSSMRGPSANGIRDANSVVRKSNTAAVGYRDSSTHQSRQYLGPTEALAGANPPGYQQITSAGNSGQQEVYNPVYPSGGYPQAPPTDRFGTTQPPGFPQQESGTYTTSVRPYVDVGAYMQVDSEPPSHGNGRGSTMPSGPTVPRSGTAGYSSQPSTTYDSRGNVSTAYYGQQGQPSVQHPQSSTPFYRGQYDDAQDDFQRGFSEQTPYTQPPLPSAPAATANQGARRGDRDSRDPDPRERHRRTDRHR